MQKIKDFFSQPKVRKSLEKYAWEVGVLSLGLLGSIAVESNIGWLVVLVPVMNQITKWINVNKIKK